MVTQSHPDPAPGQLLLTCTSLGHSWSSGAHRPCASAWRRMRKEEVTDVKSREQQLALAPLGRGSSAPFAMGGL